MSDDGSGETPITSVRFPEEQLREMDAVLGTDGERSTFIREATGRLIYHDRVTTGRADAIDRLIGAHAYRDEGPLRELVTDSLTISSEPARTGQTGDGVAVRGTTAYGPDAFYGIGETTGAAVDDLIDTVYDAATARAERLYGMRTGSESDI